MSFSLQVKEELARIEPKKKCCELAELSGLIRIEGALHIGPARHDGPGSSLSLHTSSDSAAVARRILKLVKRRFNLETELTLSQVSRLDRRRQHIIYIPPQKGLVSSLQEVGILDRESRLNPGIPALLLESPCCAAAYLRGIFLGGGSISEPKRGYHLEISTTNATLAEEVASLMEREGLTVKLRPRKRDHIVYLKDANRIVDFLALLGARNALFEWENLLILRILRNEVNRVVNCETANLGKAARAAVKQVQEINLLDEKRGINNLPPALRDAARARLKHPTATIKELGDALSPPSSKSAVYHRLRRMSKLAQQL
ncbi:MAG: DNA-binding protein WhiA [Actinomycetota bacterium]